MTPPLGDDSSAHAPRIVLDTNTVLALWMFRDSALAALRAWIEAGSCRLYSREDALEELRRVLAYEQFGLGQGLQMQLYAEYRERLSSRQAALSSCIRGTSLDLPACKDSDDQKFLEIAALSGAQGLLTRDKALLRLAKHRRIRPHFAIISPDRFLAPLERC